MDSATKLRETDIEMRLNFADTVGWAYTSRVKAHNATVDWHARKRLDATSAKCGLADGFWSRVVTLAPAVRDDAMIQPRATF